MIDYSKMTDEKLNEAAALAMGCEILHYSDSIPYCNCPDRRHAFSFSHSAPHDWYLRDYANDLRHAAEFMAFVSPLGSEWRWSVWQTSRSTWRVALFVGESVAVISRFENTSLARAETICCLMACDVMKKGN